MENIERIFHYLKNNGKSRPSVIIKNVSIPRRKVFKSLKMLHTRGLARKQGFHPKIFYSLLPGAQLEPQDDEPAEEQQLDLRHKIHHLERELGRALATLKSREADLRFMAKEKEELNKRCLDMSKEITRLSKQLKGEKSK